MHFIASTDLSDCRYAKQRSTKDLLRLIISLPYLLKFPRFSGRTLRKKTVAFLPAFCHLMNEVILDQFLAERDANSCCLPSALAVYQDFLSLVPAGWIRQASVLRQQNRKFVYFYRVFQWTAFSFPQRIPCFYILQ